MGLSNELNEGYIMEVRLQKYQRIKVKKDGNMDYLLSNDVNVIKLLSDVGLIEG